MRRGSVKCDSCQRLYVVKGEYFRRVSHQDGESEIIATFLVCPKCGFVKFIQFDDVNTQTESRKIINMHAKQMISKSNSHSKHKVKMAKMQTELDIDRKALYDKYQSLIDSLLEDCNI